MTDDTLGRVAQRLPEILLAVSSDGRIVDANAAAANRFGLPIDRLRNLPLSQLIDDSGGDLHRFLARCAATGSPLTGRLDVVDSRSGDTGRYRCTGFALEPAGPATPATVVIRMAPAADATRQFRLLTERIDALGREVERRLRAEQILDRQRETLQMIAEDRSLEHVLDMLTGFIDEHSNAGCKSSILLLDAESATLRHGAAPSLPEEYCVAIDGVGIGPSVGSCGTAAFRNEPVAVSDIASDPLWDGYAEVALASGLRSCFSTPITGADRQVLGTFALYYDIPREPDPGDRQLVDLMARSAALAIERSQAAGEIRELLSRERIARQDAEEANRSKDEFLAMVSHELRNPLNAILGWARVLNMDSSDPENLASGLDAIERNAALQARLINEILDYSRIKAGKLGMEPEPTDIDELVRATVDSAQPDATARQIALRYQSNLDESVVLAIDPNRIQQVVNNIVGNALKFTPEDGSVDVQVSAGRKHVQIEVSDTGCGIDAEFLPHIFERFRQQDSTSQRKHEGLGLGLAIAREVVELHSGDVTVHSDGRGAGSRFTVRLPLRRRRSQAAAADSGELPRLQGLRILAVDDAADARSLLKTLFASAGATVHLAASGSEALDLAAREPLDILLCDIGMPGMDGYEVISKMRAREAEAGRDRLPAIALTAFARNRDRRRAIEAGFDAHMAKPIDPAMLMRAVASTARP